MTCLGSPNPAGRAVLKPVMGMGWVPGAQDQHQPWGGGRNGAGGHGLTWPAPSAIQRHSLVTDKCFLSAIECLQKIM